MSQNETTTVTGANVAEEQTSAMIRVAVLVVFTLCFASLWSQAKPDPELLAQRQQIVPNMSAPLSLPHPVRAMARITSPPVKVASRTTAAESTPAAAIVETKRQPAEGESDVLAISQSLTIVRDGLQISTEELLQHIRQLPMGTPNGDYRIIDAQGGTGWLRVRMQSAFQQSASGSESVVTTSVSGTNVTFIRVQPVAGKPAANVVR